MAEGSCIFIYVTYNRVYTIFLTKTSRAFLIVATKIIVRARTAIIFLSTYFLYKSCCGTLKLPAIFSLVASKNYQEISQNANSNYKNTK